MKPAILLSIPLLAVVLAACGGDADRAISEVRTVQAPAQQPAAQEEPAPPPKMPHAMPRQAGPSLSWDAPDSWKEAAPKPMRLVTFDVDGAECYVTILSGMAGGLELNINRWRSQLDQPPLTAEELAALPAIDILDQKATLVEASGALNKSGDHEEGYALIGAICPLDRQTVFVKMVGPEATVKAQRDSFLAFCASIK